MVISVNNTKGGVGKSTTITTFAQILAAAGYKVLVIDLDPQMNTTRIINPEYASLELNYEHLFCEKQFRKETVEEFIISTSNENINLLPADKQFFKIIYKIYEVEKQTSAGMIFKKNIDFIKDDYDYIIIDCPPSLSMLTINAMTTADTVLVPIQCEYYALEGLNQVLKTVSLVKKKLNPQLETEGVVFTMYDARTNLSLQVVESVKSNLNQNIYKTIIPRNVRLAEAPSYGLPINLYDPKSKGTESYMLLAEEVINKGE